MESNSSRALRKRVTSANNHCFACGASNPIGLHLHFECEDGVVRTRFVPGPWHQGWEGIVHGGILTTLLDEAMAYVLYFDGIKGLTARMEVRFRAPVHQDDTLEIEARATQDSRRLIDVEGRILKGSEVVAESSARFMKVGRLTDEESV